MQYVAGHAPARRAGRWLVAALVPTLALVACSATPTSPSSQAPGPGSFIVGAASDQPPAVPSALVPTPPQALGATKFLAFGDSITYGVLSSFDGAFLILDEPGSYPTLLRSMLTQDHAPQSFTVVNMGFPGETAREGVDRLPGVLAFHRPQVVMLLEGINDLNFGVPLNQVAGNVLSLVQTARLFNCTVLVATMPQTYYSVDPADGRIRENSADKIVPFNNEVRQLVSGLQNVYIVDVYAAFGNNRSLMGGDGLHPTSAGYQLMAQVFHQAISSVFPVRGSVQ